MAFGLPAHHVQEHHPGVDDPEWLHEAVMRTVAKLSWDLKKQDPEAGRYLASTGMDLWSWGEMIRIEILPDLTLRITSRCSFHLQCLDWGQNRHNVEDFLVTLNEVLEEG